jgi:FecR protein
MEGVMATCTATGGASLLRAALLVTTGLILSIGGPAWAGVGVTSGADGDPLGKPPNENERILRIGIDVQANELVTTGANDRAHLVFLDGSSLTVGPEARLTIDRFVFDPSTQKGELAINATKGVFRLVGGKISKTNAIAITTPSSTIGIRGGITIFAVTQNQTTADFIFGKSMTVTAGGKTETATRMGTQVITNAGGVPGALTLLKPGSVAAAMGNLEGAKSNNNNSPDQSAQSSGFSSKNSGQSIQPGFNQNNPPNPNNNALTNAVSNSGAAANPLNNSTAQNTGSSNTLTNIITTTTTTTTTTPTATTTTTTTPNNAPNNNPTPPPPPTTTSQTGFAAGLVVIVRQGDDSDDVSTRVRRLRPGTVSITTDAANNQTTGTIVVGLNSSHHPATATLQVSGAGNVLASANTPATVLASANRFATVLASANSPATCTCEFLSWGVWASSVPDPRNNGKTYTAYGTYVAGTPTTAVQLPQTGIATYSGFMAGFAQNGSNGPYPASGIYRNEWNFQYGRGAFTGSFDGRGYSGTTQGTGGTTFAGTFTSTGGHHRSGSLSGGFFSSPTDAAAYQAGTFSIGGHHSRYQASGIFAAQH